ncbi:MAG TPA: ArsA-related P-loop ATPase [Oligoflexia bacterium]|nr:ArsA-related P-loop ATPase [Oligoflexia bacterium]
MFPSNWKTRKIIFVLGKGGVGKSTVSLQIAHFLAQGTKTILLCRIGSVHDAQQVPRKIAPGITELSLNSKDCFHEYVKLKLPIKTLSGILLGSKITDYLQNAAPGIPELVMTGKVWFERENFDHVVVDMPSSGYALTMLQTPKNFGDLFPGGPIYQDCHAMLETFSNKNETALVVVTLPEEMPVQESCEFADKVTNMLAPNRPYLVINRVIPSSAKLDSLYEKLGRNQDARHPFVANLCHVRAVSHGHARSIAGIFADEKLTPRFAEAPVIVYDQDFLPDSPDTPTEERSQTWGQA